MKPALSADPFAQFAGRLNELPSRHPRRLAFLLAQLGLLITVASFCVSIAGMNIGLMVGLAGCLFAGAPLHRCIGLWPLLAFIAWLALTSAIQGESREIIPGAAVPVGLLVAQVIFHPEMPGAERFRRCIAYVMVITVLASVLLSVGQFSIGRGSNRPFRIDPAGEHFFRSSGFFSIHLTQGAVVGLMFFLLGPVTAGLSGFRRYLSLGAAALGVAICGSRAALLGFVFAVCSTIAARGRKHLLLGVVVGVVLIGVVLGILRMTQPARFERLLAMEDGRWPIWRTSIHLIAEQPLLGCGGSQSFRAAYAKAYPLVESKIPNEFPKGAPHAHNTHLAQAAEHGIPFAILWVILLVAPLLHLWRVRATHPTIYRCAVGMAVMAVGFGQFENLDGETSRVLWTGLGMLLALRLAPPALAPVANPVPVDVVKP